jgi:hypothetical protein
VDVAYGHHENLDGTGYPRGLLEHQLNQNCKIVAVVDKYDAISSARPYKIGYDHLEAVAILNRLAHENKIDNRLASAFVNYLGIYPPGTIVALNTQEVAIVLESKPGQRLRPIILVVRDKAGNPIERFVDMSEKTTDEHGHPYKIKSVHKPQDFNIDMEHYQSVIVQAFN